MKKVFLSLILCLVVSMILTTCEKDPKPAPILKEGINLTILAFNNGIKYTKEFTVVDANSAASLKQWIDNLSQDDGTALFYTVDSALNAVKNARFPSSLNGVSLITFTDGIDNASVGFNSKYTTRQAYQEAMKQRITTEKFHNFTMQAYGIGVPSADVGNQTEEFKKAIRDISSSNDNSYVLNQFEEVQAIFSQIASTISSSNTTIDAVFKISFGGIDQICLVFDGQTVSASTCKITANLNSDKSLSNIIYTGLTSASGSNVVATDPNGAIYSYTFKNIKKTDGTAFTVSNAKLYKQSLGWGIDSEFNPNTSSNTVTTYKTTAIALVLDISSSLGNNLSSVKQSAKAFIDNLVSPKEYCTVTYSANGGNGTPPSKQSVLKGQSVTLAQNSNLTKPNFAFSGWNAKQDGTGTHYNPGSNYAVNANIVMYAEWKAGYSVTFDKNAADATGTMPPQSFVQGVSQQLTANAFTRPNFAFAGWATSATGNVVYSNQQNITPTENLTLYAKWVTIPTYSVTYNINSGTGTTPSPQSGQSGSTITLASGSGITRPGYNFGGWNTNNLGTGTNYNAGSSYTLTANVNLYAEWIFSCGSATVTDCQGNVYHTVLIGTQCWTKQNMKATKYDTNSELPNVTISTSSSAVYTPYYTVSTLSHSDKGHLYNWAAAVALANGQSQTTEFSGKRQGICPNGWHVPTDAEWRTMEYLLIDYGCNWDGTTSVNKLAKSLVEVSPGNRGSWDYYFYSSVGVPGNTIGEDKRNCSGFMAIPAGYASGNIVSEVGQHANFFSSTAADADNAFDKSLSYMFEKLYSYTTRSTKSYGHSVRCVRD